MWSRDDREGLSGPAVGIAHVFETMVRRLGCQSERNLCELTHHLDSARECETLYIVMNGLPDVKWHSKSASQTVECLESDAADGLHPEEAARRLACFGFNEVCAAACRPAWLRFLLQFHQALVYLLLAAVVVSALLGEWVDAAVIFGVVVVNAIVGFLQESKAEDAIGALAEMVITEATVRRSGERLQIPSREVVSQEPCDGKQRRLACACLGVCVLSSSALESVGDLYVLTTSAS